MIQYFISNGENTTRLTLEGKLLSDSDLKAVSAEVEKFQNWNIILDLKDLTHVNSSGIAFMVRMLTRSRINGGDTVMASVNANLKKLFDITKMNEVFTIYQTIEEANNHFNQ